MQLFLSKTINIDPSFLKMCFTSNTALVPKNLRCVVFASGKCVDVVVTSVFIIQALSKFAFGIKFHLIIVSREVGVRKNRMEV